MFHTRGLWRDHAITLCATARTTLACACGARALPVSRACSTQACTPLLASLTALPAQVGRCLSSLRSCCASQGMELAYPNSPRPHAPPGLACVPPHLPTLPCTPTPRAQVERYLSSLRSCYASQGMELVGFERHLALKKSGGNHCHINVIGVPMEAGKRAKQVGLLPHSPPGPLAAHWQGRGTLSPRARHAGRAGARYPPGRGTLAGQGHAGPLGHARPCPGQRSSGLKAQRRFESAAAV